MLYGCPSLRRRRGAARGRGGERCPQCASAAGRARGGGRWPPQGLERQSGGQRRVRPSALALRRGTAALPGCPCGCFPDGRPARLSAPAAAPGSARPPPRGDRVSLRVTPRERHLPLTPLLPGAFPPLPLASGRGSGRAAAGERGAREGPVSFPGLRVYGVKLTAS